MKGRNNAKVRRTNRDKKRTSYADKVARKKGKGKLDGRWMWWCVGGEG